MSHPNSRSGRGRADSSESHDYASFHGDEGTPRSPGDLGSMMHSFHPSMAAAVANSMGAGGYSAAAAYYAAATAAAYPYTYQLFGTGRHAPIFQTAAPPGAAYAVAAHLNPYSAVAANVYGGHHPHDLYTASEMLHPQQISSHYHSAHATAAHEMAAHLEESAAAAAAYEARQNVLHYGRMGSAEDAVHAASVESELQARLQMRNKTRPPSNAMALRNEMMGRLAAQSAHAHRLSNSHRPASSRPSSSPRQKQEKQESANQSRQKIEQQRPNTEQQQRLKNEQQPRSKMEQQLPKIENQRQKSAKKSEPNSSKAALMSILQRTTATPSPALSTQSEIAEPVSKPDQFNDLMKASLSSPPSKPATKKKKPTNAKKSLNLKPAKENSSLQSVDSEQQRPQTISLDTVAVKTNSPKQKYASNALVGESYREAQMSEFEIQNLPETPSPKKKKKQKNPKLPKTDAPVMPEIKNSGEIGDISADNENPADDNSVNLLTSSCTATKKRKISKQPGSGKRSKKEIAPTISPAASEPWCCASTPLALASDQYWLTELWCFLRSEFIEAFGAVEDDLNLPLNGRTKPSLVGQVGLRCKWCKSKPFQSREQLSLICPSTISGIYNGAYQMLRMHFDLCKFVPEDIKKKVSLLQSVTPRGGRNDYWVMSARRLGLKETPHGLFFERDPAVCRNEVQQEEISKLAAQGHADIIVSTLDEIAPQSPEKAELATEQLEIEASPEKNKETVEESPVVKLPLVPNTQSQLPVVFPKDNNLVSKLLFVAFDNLHLTKLQEADKIGCYRMRPTGYPGVACNHCVGISGNGRYFPPTEQSLSQTTTTQTIVNHLKSCVRCPQETRELLKELLKVDPKNLKKEEKPIHGGRKVFFRRVWCRIQGMEEPSTEQEVYHEKKKTAARKSKAAEFSPPKKERKDKGTNKNVSNSSSSPTTKSGRTGRSSRGRNLRYVQMYDEFSSSSEGYYDGESEDDEGEPGNNDSSTLEVGRLASAIQSANTYSGSEDETETSEEANTSIMTEDDASQDASEDIASAEKLKVHYHGQKSLSTPDDTYFLSDLVCFAKSECVEAFTVPHCKHAEELDDIGGPLRRCAVVPGQVGIRCIACANKLAPKDRSESHAEYPPRLEDVPRHLNDLIKKHLAKCTSITKAKERTLKSLRGYGYKKSTTDQLNSFWQDSLAELGLGNWPNEAQPQDELTEAPKPGGIRFIRDPCAPSPAVLLLGDDADDPELTSDLIESRNVDCFASKNIASLNGFDTSSNQMSSNLASAVADFNDPDGFLKPSWLNPDDRLLTTDFMFFLLYMTQPCGGKNSKPGSSKRNRSTDEVFYGLECRWCAHKRGQKINTRNVNGNVKSSFSSKYKSSCGGRHFPVNAKVLGDLTVPNIQQHMLSDCRHCPEAVRASLRFLLHRHSIQTSRQKRMKGGKKKAFFELMWDRLQENKLYKYPPHQEVIYPRITKNAQLLSNSDIEKMMPPPLPSSISQEGVVPESAATGEEKNGDQQLLLDTQGRNHEEETIEDSQTKDIMEFSSMILADLIDEDEDDPLENARRRLKLSSTTPPPLPVDATRVYTVKRRNSGLSGDNSSKRKKHKKRQYRLEEMPEIPQPPELLIAAKDTNNEKDRIEDFPSSRESEADDVSISEIITKNQLLRSRTNGSENDFAPGTSTDNVETDHHVQVTDMACV